MNTNTTFPLNRSSQPPRPAARKVFRRKQPTAVNRRKLRKPQNVNGSLECLVSVWSGSMPLRSLVGWEAIQHQRANAARARSTRP